jgi:YggT family protein
VWDLVRLVLTLAFYAIILWIVLSYIVNFGRLPWGHPVRKIYDALGRVIDPVLRPIRNTIPPLPLGQMRLDLSPIILIIGLQVIIRFLPN